ncbi:MAG: CHAD domain-containing protein [Geothrix sp.]|uniref:CHAD domain-containing protein n=1 Tax=Geothrix sp. TaxID=1962974 RepID=UPI00181967ED|nr:CHAD domain-containing protein [Geothrix sp.]NWJ41393.1 CHAD domain-containing protein [Geothrix sp.]WIL20620.1 MAG: CHAD domain-containing protein [Geothrix sp.]
MHPAELAILLHRALEVRLARLQELLDAPDWVDDDEQLHQVRVSARRLGAVLDLVDAEVYPGHKGQRRALKGLVDTLGLPRELDVHAGHLRAHLLQAGTPAQAAVLEHLLEQVDRGRAKARRAMRKELDRLRLPDLRRLLDVPSLQDPFQATSLQEAAWTCLEARAEAALGGLPGLCAHEDPAALHKTRVRIKKLRYAVEALEAAFAEPPEALLKDLRALQTVLGDHHDLAALEALLWEAEAQLRLRERQVLGAGVLDLLGGVAEARRTIYGRFVELAGPQGPAAFARAVRPALGLPPVDGILA